MMLKYQDKKQLRKNKNNIRNIIALSLFFLITALGIWGFLGGPLNFLSRPILKAGDWIAQGFQNSSYYFNTKKTLLVENNLITEENLSLKAKMLNYEIVEKENLDLKNILNKIKKPSDFVLANILTKSNRSIYDTVILDVGLDEGVEVGDTVYAYGEIPIGKITEAYNNTSLLTLFTSSGLKTEGFINGVNASVELIGRGGGNFETVIPLELKIDNGTMIYTPGFTSQVVAIVVDVISRPNDPFKKIILNSPVNIEILKWVQIKTN